MSYIVDLADDLAADAFYNAHAYILSLQEYGGNAPRVIARKRWEKEFGVKITYVPENEAQRADDDGLWTELVFPDEQSYFLFLLQWR